MNACTGTLRTCHAPRMHFSINATRHVVSFFLSRAHAESVFLYCGWYHSHETSPNCLEGRNLIETERLLLRNWEKRDREPFAQMNNDVRVMEFMPGCLSAVESNFFAERIESHFREHGYGLYAAELRTEHIFIGFVGLLVPKFQAHFTPCVEIGWRLAADYWGRGLATEGAQAIVQHAFEVLDLKSLVSFTVPANVRSRRVMEKIGMNRNPSDDFDHPNLPVGHPLRRHVLYRLSAP
jgi:RimJ/RimL family protein N-acetyltransferase